MSDHQIMFNNKCPDKVCKASIAKSKKELKRIYINLKSKSPNKDHLSDVQKYGIEHTKIKGWEKGYYVFEECQINGPVDIIFMKFINGERIVYNIDSKGIHPNCRYFPQGKRKVSSGKFLERDLKYKRIQSISWRVEDKNFTHKIKNEKNGQIKEKFFKSGFIVFKDANNKIVNIK